MRPGGGQNGRQTCNACRALVVQATLRKQAARSSLQRLQPLRKRLRLRQILRETWESIAENLRAKEEKATTATDLSETTKEDTKECQEVTKTTLRKYVCPALPAKLQNQP